MTDTTTDPVTERGQQEDAVNDWYNSMLDQAERDQREETTAAWTRYQHRVEGLTAEYQTAINRIRNGT